MNSSALNTGDATPTEDTAESADQITAESVRKFLEEAEEKVMAGLQQLYLEKNLTQSPRGAADKPAAAKRRA